MDQTDRDRRRHRPNWRNERLSVHYKANKEQQTQKIRHKGVEFNNGNGLKHDLENEVDITESFVGHKHEYSRMITELGSTRDGHLSQISNAKHCIELKSKDVRPIHCPAYTAAPKQGNQRRTSIKC